MCIRDSSGASTPASPSAWARATVCVRPWESAGCSGEAVSSVASSDRTPSSEPASAAVRVSSSARDARSASAPTASGIRCAPRPARAARTVAARSSPSGAANSHVLPERSPADRPFSGCQASW